MGSHSVVCSMVTGAAVGAASEGGPLNASLDKQIEELKGRVEADVTDFDAWTALLSTCEKLVSNFGWNDLDSCRRILTCLFFRETGFLETMDHFNF